MNKLNTLALGAALAGGCRDDGRVVVGGELDSSISPQQCFDNITGDEVALDDQVGAVGNPSRHDASATLDGDFHDKYEFIQTDLFNNAVLLAAIGNINGRSNTIREGQMYADGHVSEDFGNDDITLESPIVDAYVDFGDVPSLDGTEINTVVTDSTCSRLYSPVYDYTVEDYGYENEYYVEEHN